MLRAAQEGEFFGSFLLKKENSLALSHARRIFRLFLAQEGELFRMVLEVSSYRGTGYRRTRKTLQAASCKERRERDSVARSKKEQNVRMVQWSDPKYTNRQMR